MKNYWMIRFKRISFYGMLALFLISWIACTKSEKPVKFLIVSDLHAPDVPDGKERMQAIVDAANQEEVDFIIGGFYSFG